MEVQLIYVVIPISAAFSSIMGYHGMLNTVPCGIQYLLIVYSFHM